MREVFQRIGLCFLAVSCFCLGAWSAGAKLPAAEQLVSGAYAAAADAFDREKAEQYLREKLPVLLSELSEWKKYFPPEEK